MLAESILTEAKDKKPSEGLSKKKKSEVVKKAKAGKDIGKKGKGFEKVAKKAAKEVAKKATKKATEKIAKNSVKSIPAGSKPLTKKTSGKPNYIYKDKEMLAIKESLKNVKLKKQGNK